MIVSAVVAAAKGNVIGVNNTIPWHLPADLRYFKQITSNAPIIMGRRCFESIGRPLPNRTNIVLSRDSRYQEQGVIVAPSIEVALETAEYVENRGECFIIGGEEVYKASSQYWQRIYYTAIDLDVAGTVFFPKIDPDRWCLVSTQGYSPDEKNKFSYEFRVYELCKM
jgi:Dihydrofolate reductase